MATEKIQLKSFKMNELKEILEAHDLPISGNKPILIDRVWGILHPDEKPVEVKKKRGRKAGSKNKSKNSTNNRKQTKK